MPSVFVAYPYLISKQDYRGAYGVVAEEFGVEFAYADEEITNKHILEKIEKMMEDADLLCPAGRRPRQADEAQMFGSPQAEPTPGGKDAVASLDALRVEGLHAGCRAT